ncbi:MAG TPA: amidohydrolase family protein, partial [Burkholderiaceae bacterium]
YWRERKLFSLEQAVHKMTGLTAKTFRVQRRGALRPGAYADVVVFDPARIADTATYAQPISASVGIQRVYVNGRLAYAESDGARVLAQAGRMLHRAA